MSCIEVDLGEDEDDDEEEILDAVCYRYVLKKFSMRLKDNNSGSHFCNRQRQAVKYSYLQNHLNQTQVDINKLNLFEISMKRGTTSKTSQILAENNQKFSIKRCSSSNLFNQATNTMQLGGRGHISRNDKEFASRKGSAASSLAEDKKRAEDGLQQRRSIAGYKKDYFQKTTDESGFGGGFSNFNSRPPLRDSQNNAATQKQRERESLELALKAKIMGKRLPSPSRGTHSPAQAMLDKLEANTAKIASQVSQSVGRLSKMAQEDHKEFVWSAADLPQVTPAFKMDEIKEQLSEQNKAHYMMSKTITAGASCNSPFKNSRLQELQSRAEVSSQHQNQRTDEYGFTTATAHQQHNMGAKTMTAWHSTNTLPLTTTPAAAAIENEEISFQQVRTHINNLLKANSNHDKSERLFLFLKKQARKKTSSNMHLKRDTQYEDRQTQRKMLQAAMDESVKVGPVSVPAKLKKADNFKDQRLLMKNKSQKASLKGGKKMKQSDENDGHQGELYNNRQMVSEQSLEEHQQYTDNRSSSQQLQNNLNHLQRESNTPNTASIGRQKLQSQKSVLQNYKVYDNSSKRELEINHDQQAFDFQSAIFNMLEKSCNLKLVAKRKEYMEEMETEMKLTGFKLQERVKRVINKLFDKQIDLDDVFIDRGGDDKSDDDEVSRPTHRDILSKAVLQIDEMCNMCKKYTEMDEEIPLIDQMKGSDDDELPMKETRRKQALREINRRLERQRLLLMQIGGKELDQPPVLDFEPQPFDDENKVSKQRILAKVIKEKFGTDGQNKIELKTCQTLLDELMKQVRVWSGKHADLITGLFQKQKEFRLENQRIIQKKAHLIRDKLSKTLIQMTTKLESTQQNLVEKTRMLDQALKAQSVMDQNLSKSYDLYNSSNQRQLTQEKELEQLRCFIMKWMPNFHKYAFHESFNHGIKFIFEHDEILNDDDEAKIWQKQELAQHFDSEERMWGISPRSTPDTIFFNGDSLRYKFTAEELWLRSDVVRLTKIFNVATPDKVELEGIKKQFNIIQWKSNQMDDQINNQTKELRLRWKQVEQLKKVEIDLIKEQSRLLTENTHMKGIIEVDKFDKGAQVEIISSNMINQKLSKFDKKVLAQHRKEQLLQKKRTIQLASKQKSTTSSMDHLSLPLKGSIGGGVSEGKPKQEALDSIIFETSQRSHMQREQTAILQAVNYLNKMFEIEFKQLQYSMDQRVIKRLFQKKKYKMKIEYEPKYTQLGQFFSQLVLKYPLEQKSAWPTLVDVMEDNGNDLMQGLHDLYGLGEQDWRFLLVQYVCGVFFNKTPDKKQINACLVDKYESSPANLVAVILINAKVDTDAVFGQQLDSEHMIDLDIVIQSLTKGLRNILRNHRIFMELVFPQVIIIAYQRLMKDVEIIEATSYESETLERTIYQLDINKVSEKAIQQVEFFNKIVNAINKFGLSELHPDMRSGTDEISIEAFMEFITETLKIDIPEVYQNTDAFSKFVQHRILNFKSHSVNIDQQFEQVDKEIDGLSSSETLRNKRGQQCQLTKMDLESLQHIVIVKKLPLRKALFTAVHTAFSLVRIKQSFFEPVFNRYADRMTFGNLNLEGTFYQALLFIAKSNISNVFLDNVSQNTATLQINDRARNLINSLKKVKKLQFIALPKFTNICLELDLLEYIPATLKRLGRNQLLKLPASMYRCSEAIQEINPAFSKSNQIVHQRCEKYLLSNELANILNQSSKQFFMSVKYCAMLLRSKFFSSVSDIHDEDRIAQSFNIFIDCELSELSSIVLIASLNGKKLPSQRVPDKTVNNSAQRQKALNRRASQVVSPTENSTSLRKYQSQMQLSPSNLTHNLTMVKNKSKSKRQLIPAFSRDTFNEQDNFEDQIKKQLTKVSRQGSYSQLPEGTSARSRSELNDRKQSTSGAGTNLSSSPKRQLTTYQSQSFHSQKSGAGAGGQKHFKQASAFSPIASKKQQLNSKTWYGIQPKPTSPGQRGSTSKNNFNDNYHLQPISDSKEQSLIESNLVSPSRSEQKSANTPDNLKLQPVLINNGRMSPSPLQMLSEENQSSCEDTATLNQYQDPQQLQLNLATERTSRDQSSQIHIKLAAVDTDDDEGSPYKQPQSQAQQPGDSQMIVPITEETPRQQQQDTVPDMHSDNQLLLQQKSQEIPQTETLKPLEQYPDAEIDIKNQEQMPDAPQRQITANTALNDDTVNVQRIDIVQAREKQQSARRVITKQRDDASSIVDRQSSQTPINRTRSVGSQDYSSSRLQPMSKPRVEVIKNSPSGRAHDLLKDQEYQRKSSLAKAAAGQAAKDIQTATANLQQQRKPPQYYAKHDADIEKHRQRMAKAQLARDAVFLSYIERDEATQEAANQINSDLDEQVEVNEETAHLHLEQQSQKSGSHQSKNKHMVHDQQFRPRKPIKQNQQSQQQHSKSRGVSVRSSILSQQQQQHSMKLGVEHGPSRKGELFGKGKGEIKHIVLIPDANTDHQQNHTTKNNPKQRDYSSPSSRGAGDVSRHNRRVVSMVLNSTTTKNAANNSHQRERQNSSHSNSRSRIHHQQQHQMQYNHYMMTKQAETKIKLLETFQKSKLGGKMSMSASTSVVLQQTSSEPATAAQTSQALEPQLYLIKEAVVSEVGMTATATRVGQPAKNHHHKTNQRNIESNRNDEAEERKSIIKDNTSQHEHGRDQRHGPGQGTVGGLGRNESSPAARSNNSHSHSQLQFKN